MNATRGGSLMKPNSETSRILFAGTKSALCVQARYVPSGLKDHMSGDWTARLSPGLRR